MKLSIVKLSIIKLVILLLTILVVGMSGTPFYMYLPKYYGELGLSTAALALLLFIVRTIDAVQDPYLGQLFDKKTEYHQWFWFFGYILLGVGFYIVFSASSASLNISRMVHFLVGGALLSLGFSIIQILSVTVINQLNTQLRQTLMSVRELIVLSGVIVGVIWIESVSNRSLVYGLEWFSLKVFLPLCIASACIAFAIIRSYAHAHHLYLPEKIIQVCDKKNVAQFKKSISPLYGLLATSFVTHTSMSSASLLYLYFVEDILQLKSYIGIFFSVYMLSALVIMPMIPKLIQYIDVAKLWCIGIVISICSFLTLIGSYEGSTVLYVMVCIISGVGLGVELACIPISLSNAIHKQQLVHKQNYIFALNNFFSKFSLAVAAIVVFSLWSLLNLDQTIERVKWLYIFVPIGFKCLALGILVYQSPLKNKQ